MIEGSVECPQCNHVNYVDCYYHSLTGSQKHECEDCGCEFRYEYEVVMIINDIEAVKEGTNWDDD